jgi:hypothetical protein
MGAGISTTGLTLPLKLTAGQSTAFTVKLAPQVSGAVSGSISLISNAPNSPTVISVSGAGGQPQLSISSSNLSFGNVFVGSSTSQTVTLANSGTAALTISQVNVIGAGFGTGGFATPLTLNVGQSTALTITFAPTAPGAVSGNVSVVSNAVNPPGAITVSGTGAQPQLTVTTPTPVDLGNVNVGGSNTKTVTIQNSGNTSVTITQASASGSGFTLTALTVPLTLAASQSTSFTVQFAPAAAGSVVGSVTILSNAVNSPLTISLMGTGVQTVTHSVALSWIASTTPGVSYNVYRGSQTGGPYTRLNGTPVASTAYTDTTVLSGLKYFYVVTAVDSSNIESVYSNEVPASIP